MTSRLVASLFDEWARADSNCRPRPYQTPNEACQKLRNPLDFQHFTKLQTIRNSFFSVALFRLETRYAKAKTVTPGKVKTTVYLRMRLSVIRAMNFGSATSTHPLTPAVQELQVCCRWRRIVRGQGRPWSPVMRVQSPSICPSCTSTLHFGKSSEAESSGVFGCGVGVHRYSTFGRGKARLGFRP